MKVAFTSYIHSDITENNRKLIAYLANQVEKINPDVFVIAGDVSNSVNNLEVILKEFENLSCTKIMVPGNHDVWIESNQSLKKGKDSFYKYDHMISDICSKVGFVYPISEPLILQDTAIIGNIGWYDYSLADKCVYAISLSKRSF